MKNTPDYIKECVSLKLLKYHIYIERFKPFFILILNFHLIFFDLHKCIVLKLNIFNFSSVRYFFLQKNALTLWRNSVNTL